MSNDNGGPAFPVAGFEYYDDRNPDDVERVVYLPAKGMTLRDYFAAKAMQSFVTSWPDDHKVDASAVSRMSYQIADAMLEARK